MKRACWLLLAVTAACTFPIYVSPDVTVDCILVELPGSAYKKCVDASTPEALVISPEPEASTSDASDGGSFDASTEADVIDDADAGDNDADAGDAKEEPTWYGGLC